MHLAVKDLLENSLCAGVFNVVILTALDFERLHTYTCMCQNACLCQCLHKHSNLGLKWKQTAEKESTRVKAYCIFAALKVTASLKLMLIRQQKSKSLTAFD